MQQADKLFSVVDGKVKLLREELELIPEFRPLLALNYNKGEGDVDGRKRHRAEREFTYMWFMYSFLTPYYDSSESERHEESLKTADLPSDYKFSEELKAAIARYKSLQNTLVLRLINAARKGIDKLISYYETIDFTERTATGAVVHDPGKFMASVKQIADLQVQMQQLDELQRKELQTLSNGMKSTKQVGFIMEQAMTNAKR